MMNRVLLLSGISFALPSVIYKVSQTHGYDSMTLSINPVEPLASGVEISGLSAFYLGTGHMRTKLTSTGQVGATFNFSIVDNPTAKPASDNCSITENKSVLCQLDSVPLTVGEENTISFTKTDGPDDGFVTWEGFFGSTSAGKITMKAGLLGKGDLNSYTSITSEYGPTKDESPRPCLPRTHFYVQPPMMRQSDNQSMVAAKAGTPIGTGLGVDKCSVVNLAPNAEVTIEDDVVEFFYGFLSD